MTEPVRFEAEEIAPKTGDQGTVIAAAPFVAKVERLMIRVRSAHLKDEQTMLDNLQAWIDRSMSGGMDVEHDGDQVVDTLTMNVDEMIQVRTVLRRVVSPMIGLAALSAVLAGVTVWTIAADTLLLGTPLQIVVAAIIFGVAGSAFRVLLRTVTMQHEQTDRAALFMIGLARPLVGGVLAMAIFATFGAGIISLPIVSDQETTTPVDFLAGLGGTGVLTGQLAMFAFAFAAGLAEGFLLPILGRQASRVGQRRTTVEL